jgi:photosystem II stability/assembly factor-like uncharacterized protein
MKSFYLLILFPFIVNAQWTERNTLPAFLDFVYFLDDSIGYTGDEYSSFQSTDGGWTWQTATGDYAAFQKACFTDSLNGFAISYTDLFQTQDAGVTWTNISDSVNITEFYNLEERNGHIVLNGADSGQGFYWYVTTNNGQSWEMRRYHPTHSPYICFMLDENHFYSASHVGGGGNYILSSTTNGGLTWDTLPYNIGTDIYLTSLYFTSPDTGFLGFYSFAWGGGYIEMVNAQFQQLSHPDTTGVEHGVLFIKGMGNTICAGGEDGHFYCSPDKGHHWFLQPVNTNGYFKTLRAAYFWDENRIAVVGDSGRVLLTDSGIYHALNVEPHMSSDKFTLYPNPASNAVQIETTAPVEAIEVYNLQGKMVKYMVNTGQMNVSDLPDGMYVVQIIDKDGRQYRKKLMVVRE